MRPEKALAAENYIMQVKSHSLSLSPFLCLFLCLISYVFPYVSSRLSLQAARSGQLQPPVSDASLISILERMGEANQAGRQAAPKVVVGPPGFRL